jgi:hypothetical protein
LSSIINIQRTLRQAKGELNRNQDDEKPHRHACKGVSGRKMILLDFRFHGNDCEWCFADGWNNRISLPKMVSLSNHSISRLKQRFKKQ